MKTILRVAVGLAVVVVAVILGWHYFPGSNPVSTPPSVAGAPASPATNVTAPVAAPAPAPVAAPAVAPAARPVADVKLNPDGTMRSPSEILLEKAETLAKRETPPDADGKFTRTRLVKVPALKYPLLRVEEQMARDPATGTETVLHRVEMVADHVMVQLREGLTEADLAAVNEKHGGTIRRKMHTPGLYLVEFAKPTLDTAPEAAAAYRKESQVVERAGVDYVVHAVLTPNEPDFANLWGMHNTGQTIQGTAGIVDADIDAPEAWDLITGSSEIVVGVIDTGIDYNHQDLAANMWRNPGEIPNNGIDDDGNGFVDDYYGWDFANDDKDPYDDHFHGTHCAGTIGGVGNNGIGVAGVSWTVKMAALKFLSASGSGYISDGLDALNYATKMRFKLTSNSWGGGGYDPLFEAAIGTAAESNALFVAAAGNANNNNDLYPFYPASYTNANLIAVAATDNREQIAGFSCYGLTSVDLGAPGVAIYSCKQNNTYQFLNGTSMATPHVAGACALGWAYKPEAAWTEIKAAILNGVDPTAALAGKCVTGGRLNVHKTLLGIDRAVAILPYGDSIFIGPDGGPFTPDSYTYVVANLSSNTFSWTLTRTGNWLDLSQTSGTLNPGQSNSVVVTLNANAYTMTAGDYISTLTFSNNLNGVKTYRQVMLQVLDSLDVSPLTGITATGPDGGPFSPSAQVYVLSNRAATARSWTGRVTANWIELSATTGTLDPGAKQNVTLSLNANANALGVATNIASASFSNHTSRVLHVRPVTNIVYESFLLTPTDGFTSYGVQGGPFDPESVVYTISNRASSARSWTASASANWIGLSATTGSLPAGGTGTLTVSISSNANSLADGTYTGTMTFSNTTTAVRQTRPVVLRLNVDDFTEQFWYNYVDLDYRQLIFHPTNTLNGYVLHRSSATAFPVDTTDHTTVSLTDDSNIYCSLTGGKKVKLYGTQYSGFYIGSNGYITFTQGDTAYDWWNVETHFSMPRISMFFMDLNPPAGGTISWKQLSDRAVVTFYDVPYINNTSYKTDFQVEMFFDGLIRITYLRLHLGNAIAGLSRGGGLPEGFRNSDLSTYPFCPDAFAVEITQPLENPYNWMPPTILVEGKDNPITADAASPSAPITNVSFRANGAVLGADATAPYGIIWTNSPNGSYALTAIAYNSLGQSVTSPAVNVTVKIPDLKWWGDVSEDWEVAPDFTDRPGDNWVGDAYNYMDGAIARFENWANLARTNVQIQAAGVAPHSVLISNTTSKTFTFRGGDITGSAYMFKTGAGTAIFTNYAGSLSFAGGTLIQTGTIRFVSAMTDIPSTTRTQWFGTGTITLNSGSFSFAGAALFNGHTNVLANSFVVKGGRLLHGRYSAFSPKIVFRGTLDFATNAALTIDNFGSAVTGLDARGTEISGDVILRGTNSIQRVNSGGGSFLTFSGNIVNGDGPAGLIISNGINTTTANRFIKIVGTGNTYSGGTIIRNDGMALDIANFVGAVEVGTNASLGTGNVTVDAGGLLKLMWPGNINPDATLELKVDGALSAGHQTGVVWIAQNITNTVRRLVLGPSAYTTGLFSSNNAPSFISGGGVIRVAGDLPLIIVSPPAVSVPEGGTNSFAVRLPAPAPANNVTVSVARVSGDTDISANPATLVFQPNNWDVFQNVTLSAAADADDLNGTAIIRCSATGYRSAEVTAVEVDSSDQTPPQLTGALARNAITVRVTFNEWLDPVSAENAANYTINNAVSVLSAARRSADPRQVDLTVSTLNGGNYILTVNQVKDLAGNSVAAGSTASFTYTPGAPISFVDEPLNDNPGWTTEGDWAFGKPLGLGGSNGNDPAAGYTGTNVFGYNLAGDYPNNLAVTNWLTTTAIDCAGFTNVTLVFRRWLGVGQHPDDQAHIQVSADGSSWTTVWNNPTGVPMYDGSWTPVTNNLSAAADQQPVVYVRWGMGKTDASDTYCGWNIDDVQVLGAPVLSTPLLQLSTGVVSVVEGSTASFSVRLAAAPTSTVTVAVSRLSGDADINVHSGDSLIFTTGNWNQWQTVTLAAAPDTDSTNGTAVIRCAADGYSPSQLLAIETDVSWDPSYLLPWSETFENVPEMAGQLGPLDGQHGWVANNVTVTTNRAQAGTQSAQLGTGQMRHVFGGATNEVWITFWAQPVAGATNSTFPANASAVFYINTNSQVVAYSNTTPVTVAAPVTAGWNKFEVYCNYTTRTWQLAVNDTPVGSEFGFYSPAQSSFAAFNVVNDSVSNAWVDTIEIVSGSSETLDTDGDGIPDWWETLYYGGPTSANANAMAANGVNTVLQCYIAGLDPTDPSAAFRITNVQSLPSGIVLHFNTVTGRVYSVYWSSDLQDVPQLLESNLPWTSNVYTDSVHGAESKGFYRIKVQLPP
jgi:subtilisin family serine protease